MELKIGRNTYTITEDDQFLDNSSSVQLLTQSLERSSWGHKPDPVLSKRAVKEIDRIERVQHEHGYSQKCQLFSLKLDNES